MRAEQLLLAGACEQARLIAGGQISAQELLQVQYAAIAQRNPEINAIIELASLPSGPARLPLSALAGTSFGAKDNIDVQGMPTAAGLRAFARQAAADAPVVAALRAAGLHCVGKLNMHAMALGASNHNADYGHCFHPHRPGHTPGGSSGGSAAAVAAGFCSLAWGTDTMGSVRIPAAYCGVVGFKPSHETLGLAGVLPLSSMLDHLGLLARRVEDIRAAMALTAPHLPQPQDAGSRTRPWRVGVLRDAGEHGCSPEVLRACEGAVHKLSGRREVQWVDARLQGLSLTALRRAGLLLCEAQMHELVAPLLASQPEALPADLRAMLRFIETKSAIDLGKAVSVIVRTAQALEALSRGCDALLLPTAGHTAFPMDGPVPVNQADFTALANASGAPAISLPIPTAPGELPVGLQLIGRRGHDLALLDLAAWVEQALRA